MRAKNKVVIVTGASIGIGQAIAVGFAKEEALVASIARTKEWLEETKQLIGRNGGEAKIFVADLSKIDSINKVISEIKRLKDKPRELTF